MKHGLVSNFQRAAATQQSIFSLLPTISVMFICGGVALAAAVKWNDSELHRQIWHTHGRLRKAQNASCIAAVCHFARGIGGQFWRLLRWLVTSTADYATSSCTASGARSLISVSLQMRAADKGGRWFNDCAALQGDSSSCTNSGGNYFCCMAQVIPGVEGFSSRQSSRMQRKSWASVQESARNSLL